MDAGYIYKVSNIGIIYEDEWLLVVDKPHGLLTIPTPRNEGRTLTSILNQYLISRGESYRAHPCHRLDRETSGLIIYAKGKSAQKKMMDEFKKRNISKAYIAVVQGALPKDVGKITYRVDNSPAVTDFKVLKYYSGFTLVKVMPATGRKNQIRIHFKEIGHPLVGESRFSFRKDFKLKAKRALLHASELTFKHPINGQPIFLKSELPQDIANFIHNHEGKA